MAAVHTQSHTVTTWEDYVRSMSRDKLIGSEVRIRLIGITIAFSGFLRAILGVRIMDTRDPNARDYGRLDHYCFSFIIREEEID